MQACGGGGAAGAMKGSFTQQRHPVWSPHLSPFPPQKKLNTSLVSFKKLQPCHLEGSMVAGRPLSSVHASGHGVRGQSGSFEDDGLHEVDPEVRGIIDKEKNRQFRSLGLIASENFTSRAVMEAVGSILTNKYSEGLPGKRYYGGNEFIDELETLCQQRLWLHLA